MTAPDSKFVGRGALKLAHALDTFGVEVRGIIAADFGCNVGGFTDCLLQRGAARVFAVDTGYGALAWTLRKDPRVTVMERTNALHAPAPLGGVDLVVIDLGWTPQSKAVPAAASWIRKSDDLSHPRGLITLIKPHYEVTASEKALLSNGVLPDHDAQRIADRTVASLRADGWEVKAYTRSPILGGASKGHAGNAEWLAWIAPRA